jgi:hypothetical protein
LEIAKQLTGIEVDDLTKSEQKIATILEKSGYVFLETNEYDEEFYHISTTYSDCF